LGGPTVRGGGGFFGQLEGNDAQVGGGGPGARAKEADCFGCFCTPRRFSLGEDKGGEKKENTGGWGENGNSVGKERGVIST